jgi:hypothetical protein
MSRLTLAALVLGAVLGLAGFRAIFSGACT